MLEKCATSWDQVFFNADRYLLNSHDDKISEEDSYREEIQTNCWIITIAWIPKQMLELALNDLINTKQGDEVT